MPRFSTGLIVAGGLATAITLLIAWPVVLHPTQLIYGREIVGRHPDAYVAMQQFGGTSAAAVVDLPLAAVPGWLLARLLDPVLAFNLLVLTAFPLSAMGAYALARYLTASHGAGLIAGLAFAFAPAHLAHAAYHPYTAQTQWIPLYLLALVALVDRLSISRVVAVVFAGLALVLWNDYGALVAVLISPVVLVAFWAIRPDADRNLRPLLRASAVVALVAGAAIGLLWMVHPAALAGASPEHFQIDDVAFYRARWWAYLTPAVDHPVLGGLAMRVFNSQGINLQLTEEQLFLGVAPLLLTTCALAISASRWQTDIRWRFLAAAAAVGLVAAVVSLGPTSGSCQPASMAPGCLMFRVAPTLRAYARFGIVAQLMVAIGAGAGAVLLARRSPLGRGVAVALVGLAIFECWPLPARVHDVLPTTAHRWLASQADGTPVFDCYPDSQTETAIAWLMKRRMSFMDGAIATCDDPQISVKLAGLGYARAVVRRSAAASKLPAPLPPGIRLAHAFDDADVYEVAAVPPRVLTVAAHGFFPYEHEGDDWWRWMGSGGEWTVLNTTKTPQRVSLAFTLVPVGMPRRLSLTLDGAPAGTLSLPMSRAEHTVGPWTLAPGRHTLTFAADGEPVRPSESDNSKDARPLAVAFRNERWIEAPDVR